MKFVEIDVFKEFSGSYDGLAFLNLNQISSIRRAPSDTKFLVTMNNGTRFTTDTACFEKIMEEIKNDET